MTNPTPPVPGSAQASSQQSVKAAEPGTRYLVLRENEDEAFEKVNLTTARTGEAAIKAVVEKLAEADQAGTYVAVVAKRWQPMTIEPKVERSLILKAVK